MGVAVYVEKQGAALKIPYGRAVKGRCGHFAADVSVKGERFAHLPTDGVAAPLRNAEEVIAGRSSRRRRKEGISGDGALAIRRSVWQGEKRDSDGLSHIIPSSSPEDDPGLRGAHRANLRLAPGV